MDNRPRKTATLDTPSGLSTEAVRDIPPAFTASLADAFALHIKTKNFHWHMSGPHFCDHHLQDDVATASLLEVWIGEAERRTWFLYEATRHAQ